MKVDELIKELKDCADLGMDVIVKTMRTKTIPQYHLECEIYVQGEVVVIESLKGVSDENTNDVRRRRYGKAIGKQV
tara:strand:- start:6515 stop:6742 length:228 start_codon:yes stop_codon:yes gene_type:complete